jgi:hypothetical protein
MAFTKRAGMRRDQAAGADAPFFEVPPPAPVPKPVFSAREEAESLARYQHARHRAAAPDAPTMRELTSLGILAAALVGLSTAERAAILAGDEMAGGEAAPADATPYLAEAASDIAFAWQPAMNWRSAEGIGAVVEGPFRIAIGSAAVPDAAVAAPPSVLRPAPTTSGEAPAIQAAPSQASSAVAANGPSILVAEPTEVAALPQERGSAGPDAPPPAAARPSEVAFQDAAAAPSSAAWRVDPVRADHDTPHAAPSAPSRSEPAPAHDIAAVQPPSLDSTPDTTPGDATLPALEVAATVPPGLAKPEGEPAEPSREGGPGGSHDAIPAVDVAAVLPPGLARRDGEPAEPAAKGHDAATPEDLPALDVAAILPPGLARREGEAADPAAKAGAPHDDGAAIEVAGGLPPGLAKQSGEQGDTGGHADTAASLDAVAGLPPAMESGPHAGSEALPPGLAHRLAGIEADFAMATLSRDEPARPPSASHAEAHGGPDLPFHAAAAAHHDTILG